MKHFSDFNVLPPSYKAFFSQSKPHRTNSYQRRVGRQRHNERAQREKKAFKETKMHGPGFGSGYSFFPPATYFTQPLGIPYPKSLFFYYVVHNIYSDWFYLSTVNVFNIQGRQKSQQWTKKVAVYHYFLFTANAHAVILTVMQMKQPVLY